MSSQEEEMDLESDMDDMDEEQGDEQDDLFGEEDLEDIAAGRAQRVKAKLRQSGIAYSSLSAAGSDWVVRQLEAAATVTVTVMDPVNRKTKVTVVVASNSASTQVHSFELALILCHFILSVLW